MAETERKSKRRAPPKIDEDAEAEGFEKLKQNPVFILVSIAVIITLLVVGILQLSRFLSGA